MNKVELYNAVGRIIDISRTRSQDIYLNGEFIGTYQPSLYFRRGYENEPICCEETAQLKAENEKLKTALEEIREIVEPMYEEIPDDKVLRLILLKIDEVLKDE